MNKIDIDNAAKQVVSALGGKKYTKEDVEKILDAARDLMIHDAVLSSGEWQKTYPASSEDMMKAIRILVNHRDSFSVTFTDRK